MHMDRAGLQDGASGCRVTVWANRVVLQISYGVRICVVARRKMTFSVLLELEDHCPIRLAQTRGGCGNGIDDGLQVGCRLADDAEDLTCSRLLLKGFAKLIEQPRVLDGDDGLGGEVLHQFDLPAGEGAHLLAVDNKCADQFAFSKQRGQQECSNATKLNSRNKGWKALLVSCFGPSIRNMNLLFCLSEPSQWINRNRFKECGLVSFLGKGARKIVCCGGTEAFAFTKKHDAISSVTNTRRVLQHRLKDPVKLARRSRDDLQHLRCRRLLLARFFQFAPESGYFLLEIGG